jgi:hypothetical protein
VLAIPVFQAKVHLFPEKALRGGVTLASKPIFSTGNWFNGSYQSGIEKFVNDHMGFRAFLVRLHNQIQYSFFKQASAKGVVIGKNNYFFEQAYIDVYHGKYFSGRKKLEKKIMALKDLQSELENKGKTLLVVLPPGKASFYPEYFPEGTSRIGADSTIYKTYSELLPMYGINCFDANRWFLEMKDTSQHILMPQYGIHWSEYGAAIAADSLIKQVERLTGRKLPQMVFSEIKKQNFSKGTDNDIEWGMNLMKKLPSQKLSYPTIEWDYAAKDSSTTMLVVGDSFYWNWYHLGLGEKCFDNTLFWYYNKEVYPGSEQASLQVKSTDQQTVLTNSDVVLLIASESNLVNMAWGFVDKATAILQGRVEDPMIYKQKVQDIIARIKSDENWLKNVKQKAEEQNIPLDSMLVLDAKWIIENE